MRTQEQPSALLSLLPSLLRHGWLRSRRSVTGGHVLICLALLFLLGPSTAAHGQIYADFVIRHGTTPLGSFRALLEHERAPRTVANFVGLATGRRAWVDVRNGAVRSGVPFYDGITFHRLIHNFVIQGGSPNAQGTDGPGYTILDEYHPELTHSGRYILSMAKSSLPNSGGSQFFITLAATPYLDFKHSIFGSVIAGRELIDSFTDQVRFPTLPKDRPATPIVIDQVLISGPSLAGFLLDEPSLHLPRVEPVERRLEYRPKDHLLLTHFHLKARHNYLFTASSNLETWPFIHQFLALEGRPDYALSLGNVPPDRLFIQLAGVSYEEVPLAPSPSEFVQAGKSLRIFVSPSSHLDLNFTGSLSSASYTTSDGSSGTFTITTLGNFLPPTSPLITHNLEAWRLSLLELHGTFNPPAGPGGWTALNTYLSFQRPHGGWLEELPASPVRRLPFRVLSP